MQQGQDILLFLRSQRRYKVGSQHAESTLTEQELLDRYNPGHTLSQAERTRLTVRRVGLNMPKANSDDYF